jgi:hypothetical protein
MSAIQAAIGELEARRAEIDQIIVRLKGLCEPAVVTDADRGRMVSAIQRMEPLSPVTVSGRGPAPSTNSIEPVRAGGAKVLPPGSRLELVYQAVRKHGPASAVDIAEQLGIDRQGVSVALNTLKVRGMVTLRGRSTTAQWSIVARRPLETASTGEVEVVWNGTKERLGQAPSLAAARETRVR